MGAWRQSLSMRPPRSRSHRSSRCQLAGIGDAGERRLATTRPRWSSSTWARQGDHPVADADYLDYLGNLDGRDTIIDSILSSDDHILRAARGAWSSLVGRLGCDRAHSVGGRRRRRATAQCRFRPTAQPHAAGSAWRCMCACSQHADATAFVPRVVPRAVSGQARPRAS